MNATAETTTKHTPLPWRAVKNCGYINGSDGIAHYGPREVGVAIVGSYFDKELLPFNKERWDADVDIIVRAVNSHADMLAALKRCEAMVSTADGPPNWDWVREVIAKAS